MDHACACGVLHQPGIEIAAEKQPEREVAIRAWARRDPLVAEFQRRVDDTRLSFAMSVCRARIDDPATAALVGRLAHLCLIGGQQSGDRHQPAGFAHLVRDALMLLHAGAADSTSVRRSPT
ncbi:hypothetical protein [Burkholderia sp. Bp8963]|uniref:hypothetical protein n=1 Tax=Burkholderia sp. Bp8963 TaxID=2184547 RepID=UPI000F59BDF4|nr:hypothetical protein [Burkholderia sp. Bp8963]